jgi:ATP-binding cassette subfamily B protein
MSLIVVLGPASRTIQLFHSYLGLLEMPSECPDALAALPPLRTAIELRDVWFRYTANGPWVLQGLNLTIPCGAVVGLVGINGAGKSTLVKLLCRFYEIERGQILWDGVDIRDIDSRALRRRIGATFQDFMMYELTASENIGIGDTALLDDRQRIRAAAASAGVHDALERLPRGYDTLLSRSLDYEDDAGSEGSALSGGQWQRVALARSLVRDDVDLLILDEPSSGLDPMAEARIHHVVMRHARGRARLLIAHRLSALREADVIVVLRDGRIVEQGTHDQLMECAGDYARMFTVQAHGYQDVRVPMPALREIA